MPENIHEYINYSKQLKVLFIEDNKDVKEQLLKLLNNLFSSIDVKEDGEEAYYKYLEEKEKNEPYDLIITDLNIPSMNGFRLIEEIKKINKNQKFVVISAHTEPSKLKLLKNLEITKFIKKPIEYEVFIKSYIEIIDKIKLSA